MTCVLSTRVWYHWRKIRWIFSFVLVFISFPARGGVISADAINCPNIEDISAEGNLRSNLFISSSFLTSSVADKLSDLLRADSSFVFSSVLSVDHAAHILGKNPNCIHISTGAGNSYFSAVVKFNQSETDPSIYRPVVRLLSYQGFLNPECPFLQRCRFRDVLFRIYLQRPTSSIVTDSMSRDGVAIMFTRVTSEGVQEFFSSSRQLPWFYSSSNEGPLNFVLEVTETRKAGQIANAYTSLTKMEMSQPRAQASAYVNLGGSGPGELKIK